MKEVLTFIDNDTSDGLDKCIEKIGRSLRDDYDIDEEEYI